MNTGRTRFKAGDPRINRSGRPKVYQELKVAILADFAKKPQESIRQLYMQRIDLYFAYGFGKPTDRVEISRLDGLSKCDAETASVQDIERDLMRLGAMDKQGRLITQR